MKIVLFNVKYSPNLGDGVIAECLENALRQETGATVFSLDLAGRESYGESAFTGRSLAIRLLRKLPGFLRRAVVRARLKGFLKQRVSAWTAALGNADLAIIGGGNLFQDADLNFPLKISAALEAARAAGVPVAVHAVGVAPDWSADAQALFGQIRGNDVRHVNLRDEASLRRWEQFIGDAAGDAAVCGDPGLLAQDLKQPVAIVDSENGQRIGICVTHPAILQYHANQPVAGIGRDGARFYSDLVVTLCQQGERVTLFTNGAAEDTAFMASLALDPVLASLFVTGELAQARASETPADLVALIGGFRAVVAHRLHASIVAYSLRIPHVGLAWDVKVESFFQSVGREDYFVRRGGDTAMKISSLLTQAAHEGIHPGRHRDLLERAREEIRLMLQAADLVDPRVTGAVA